MSDEEWAFFERFILAVRAPNGHKPSNHRLVLDGIFWTAPTGAPWRDLPEEFGKWSSVYRQFRRWTLAGLWEEIMDALNESGAIPSALQMIDSTVVRAHHQAAGVKGGTPRQGFSRSRGGFTTKIHLLVNAHGLPLSAEITPEQTSDYVGFDLVMADNLPKPSVLLADRGYDADSIRTTMAARNVVPVIPMRKSRKKRTGSRPLPVSPAEPRRAMLQQAQERPPRRNPLRQNNGELSGIHRHRVDPLWLRYLST